MPNTVLTPLQITRKALMILHQKANFIGTIDRQHDKDFAKDGAKIGDTLRIRLPNKYTTRNTVALSTQDTVEEKVDLVVSKRLGVDVTFTSAELTLSLDDFSERILDPAISILAAGLEADAMSMALSVYNVVANQGAACTLAKVLQGRKILMDNLAPLSQRVANLNTQDNVDLITDVKNLFNDQQEIAGQYKEGYMGRAAGLDFMENTLWPRFAAGARNTAYTATSVDAAGTTLTVAAGAGAMVVGDTFTIANVFRVHPETKATTNVLQTFTVTAPYAGGAGTVSISPPLITTGAKKTVSAAPAGGLMTFTQTLSTTAGTSLLYHKQAFTMATADLIMPNGVDFKARETMDGISMRIIRAYDINTDAFPCRIDVHYGYVAQRPELAVRLLNN